MHNIVNKSCLVPDIFRFVYLLERHFCFPQSTYHLQLRRLKMYAKYCIFEFSKNKYDSRVKLTCEFELYFLLELLLQFCTVCITF